MVNDFSNEEHFITTYNENYFDDLLSSTQLSGPTAIPMELDLSIIPTENPVLADISCNLASQVNKNSDASSSFDKSAGEPCPTKKV